ncbi:uncharacterized protein LOC124660346 [Lolium rigidum]|uniref:uncharacterized protein LOC124660346 n=1 Tax=Lolium rigidum TaxID=89674 RepID=UPI001F5CC1BA|nr:uncharacterized protein LOC124660346 [Lolium rigidum]
MFFNWKNDYTTASRHRSRWPPSYAHTVEHDYQVLGQARYLSYLVPGQARYHHACLILKSLQILYRALESVGSQLCRWIIMARATDQCWRNSALSRQNSRA